MEPTNTTLLVQRESFDEELAAIPPEEREAYLKEYDEADKSGTHKQGGLIDKCMFAFPPTCHLILPMF